jgi:regulator of protease activity HflC (stomatin/prohibitin superfamily)
LLTAHANEREKLSCNSTTSQLGVFCGNRVFGGIESCSCEYVVVLSRRCGEACTRGADATRASTGVDAAAALGGDFSSAIAARAPLRRRRSTLHGMEIVILAGLGLLGLLGLSSIRIYREYERAIVFRLGRARQKALGPGPVILLPLLDRAVVVDTRTRVMQIPTQDIITHDNISMGVDAVVYADVASPSDAVLRVENYLPATLQLAATTLRSVLGRMELDDILAKRSEINDEIRQILDERTEQWGVQITAVEIKDIVLPQEMKRAMARQAEAERERRAKIIIAEGELQSAEKLTLAAAMISSQPAALQLRTLQTLVEVSAERNNTIVFPIPMDLSGRSGAESMPSVQTAATTAALAASQTRAALERGDAGALPSGERRDALAPWRKAFDAVGSGTGTGSDDD